ncbi:hypothetical protein [Paenibacillus sp. IHBB 10380]|uniref:hypothetical protein n=1 Tax=Paenibacillus sp. IHBB 10380 TaxID=1566358 RepID=UPI0005CFAD7B|nr:hypothetical protein [Paenibacillus sp. IHBB 10380]AJS58380.1 hypothetical protein UB51_07580 [Paenibacillus sp. IHBB 10380]
MSRKRNKASFGNSKHGNIRLYKRDLVGLYNEDTDKIVKITLDKDDKNQTPKISKIINKWNKRVSSYCRPILNQKFDLIVSANVSTQLCSLASYIVSQVRGSHIYQDNMLQFIHDVSKQHVQQIKKMLSTNGRAVITSEQYEWADPYIHPLAHKTGIYQYVKDPRDMLQIEIQNNIELKKDTVPGRVTEDMLDGVTILERREWIWTFNDGRHYLVKGWVVQGNS